MTGIIHEKACLKVKAEEAFEWFTEPAKLKTWLAIDARVEPFVGGQYELYWNLENKEENSTLGCKITAFELNKVLAFEWKGPTQFAEVMNHVEPLTHVTIFFVSEGDKTKVHLLHTGWGSGEKWEEARNWFASVWKQALSQLEASTAFEGY